MTDFERQRREFKKRKEAILRLRSQRFTLQYIGDLYGISRERVRQIITGYVSPRKKPKPPAEHKILTPAKRHALGLPALDPSIGIAFPNGQRDRIREMVRIRDNRTCQMCGKVWVPGTRRLDVHHLDERMEGKSKTAGITRYDIDNMDKMITVCHKCHYSLDCVRKKISKGLLAAAA